MGLTHKLFFKEEMTGGQDEILGQVLLPGRCPNATVPGQYVSQMHLHKINSGEETVMLFLGSGRFQWIQKNATQLGKCKCSSTRVLEAGRMHME